MVLLTGRALKGVLQTLHLHNRCLCRHRRLQASSGPAGCHQSQSPTAGRGTREVPLSHLGLSGTCCCACWSSMKWELANWSSRSRRPYLSVVPELQFWPPLSPRRACRSGAGGSRVRRNKLLLSEQTLHHSDIKSSRIAHSAFSTGQPFVQWCRLVPAWHNFRNARKGTRCLQALPMGLRNGLCPIKIQIKVNFKSTNAHLYTALQSKSTWSLQASSPQHPWKFIRDPQVLI